MPGEDRHASPQEDAAARLGEAINQAAATIGAAFPPLMAAIAAALRTLANDPVVRFAVDHPELLRAERPKLCWCLCAKAHPGSAVCDGEGVTTRTAVLEPYGPVKVQFCAACATAQGITRR